MGPEVGMNLSYILHPLCGSMTGKAKYKLVLYNTVIEYVRNIVYLPIIVNGWL